MTKQQFDRWVEAGAQNGRPPGEVVPEYDQATDFLKAAAALCTEVSFTNIPHMRYALQLLVQHEREFARVEILWVHSLATQLQNMSGRVVSDIVTFGHESGAFEVQLLHDGTGLKLFFANKTNR